MIELPLRNRLHEVVAVALVDDEDADLVGGRPWHCTASGYAERSELGSRTDRRRSVRLHRLILGLDHDDPLQADHINRNPLDNRRSNLRIVTFALNMQNRSSQRGSTSRYRGVCWASNMQKWYAQVRINGRQVNLGYYADEIEAANAAATFRAEHMPFSQDASTRAA